MSKIHSQTIQLDGKLFNGTFIGIDTALRKTGVCILRSGQAELSLIDSKGLRGVQRLAFIENALELCLLGETPTLSAVEDGAYEAGGRVFQLGQVNGIAQVILYKLRSPLINVSPTRLKKFFANNGGASKEKMIAAADLFLRTKNIDDNLADACGLACLAEGVFNKTPKTRKQAEVILDVEIEGVL